MNFELTEEQQMIRDSARDFAERELLTDVLERDAKSIYPTKHVRRLAELGFLGMNISPEWGGGGMDNISYAIAIEEISKCDSSVGVILAVHNSLACYGLECYGTGQQKEKYLRPMATGEKIGAFLLSEPEAGSDATHNVHPQSIKEIIIYLMA